LPGGDDQCQAETIFCQADTIMYIGENKIVKFEINVLKVRRREKMDEQKTVSTDQTIREKKIRMRGQ
jgi:hypothetical protein